MHQGELKDLERDFKRKLLMLLNLPQDYSGQVEAVFTLRGGNFTGGIVKEGRRELAWSKLSEAR